MDDNNYLSLIIQNIQKLNKTVETFSGVIISILTAISVLGIVAMWHFW